MDDSCFSVSSSMQWHTSLGLPGFIMSQWDVGSWHIAMRQVMAKTWGEPCAGSFMREDMSRQISNAHWARLVWKFHSIEQQFADCYGSMHKSVHYKCTLVVLIRIHCSWTAHIFYFRNTKSSLQQKEWFKPWCVVIAQKRCFEDFTFGRLLCFSLNTVNSLSTWCNDLPGELPWCKYCYDRNLELLPLGCMPPHTNHVAVYLHVWPDFYVVKSLKELNRR